ncbi:MAG: cell division protein SepF [Candidatus ainarchaeum sp.]|nr:cell division protein SepF [Candidatus ainarchaeum sp.]
MGFFNKVMAKDDGVDLEDFLNNLDEVQEESYDDADAFVKPMDLVVDADVTAIMNEVKNGNIALVNIADLSKRNALKLKELIGLVKEQVKAIDGDIARISQGRVLITPSKVKIIKRKGQ